MAHPAKSEAIVQHVERIRQPGRNDPCICGSGKKFKRCCLLHEVMSAPPRTFDDVILEIQAADEIGDCETALMVLEEARPDLHDPDLEGMLVERLLDLPVEEAERRLREWWDQEHDRFSGAGLARLLVERGERDAARSILKQSSGLDAWPEYWRLLAVLRDEQGDTAGAATAMELYARLASEDSDAWSGLADLQLKLNQADRALQSLRRAGDVAPEAISPRIARLRILVDQGRWRETRDLAEALLEGKYEDASDAVLYELRNLLARAYFVLGYFDAARRLWENLLAEDPDDAELRYQLALLELSTDRPQRALTLLEGVVADTQDLRVLDVDLRALLTLNEFDAAAKVALRLEQLDPRLRVMALVRSFQARAHKEWSWALEQLREEPPELYSDLWHTLKLDCMAHLDQFQEMWSTLRSIGAGDDAILSRAALGALAAGKTDLAEKLLAKIDDHQALTARSLLTLLGPVRQSKRAAEVRRQQQVDQAEKQRWLTANREQRRRVRELEQRNAALSDDLALSEGRFERLLEQVGVLSDDSGTDWEAHVRGMADRAHKDALARELLQAEQRLRQMLGSQCWESFSESARASLREGEWLFVAVEGEDRDYGAALLEYARGLERAFKDAVFVPARLEWQRRPGPLERLQDEGHDPSLAPLVRYVLHGAHLTLGSMAAALDRMSDIRRQGVAVSLLRRQLRIDPQDDRVLMDWKRTADRLALAADARNQPAHASSVSRDAVCRFRELVLGSDGLLPALGGC